MRFRVSRLVPLYSQLLGALLMSSCGGASGGGDPPPPVAGPPAVPPPEPPPVAGPPPDPVFSVVHAFSDGAEGAHPSALVRDPAGNLLGSAYGGGDPACDDAGVAGCGTIFRIDSNGVFTTLHAFSGGPADGAVPSTGLVRDEAGNLYGATYGGGAHGFGIAFKLDANGNLSVLHHFTGGADGYAPVLSLRDAAGRLYGTTGLNSAFVRCTQDCGTIFRLDAAGNFTTLYTFNGSDGDQPSGPLLADESGNIYGVTAYGGTAAGCVHTLGCGTVFKLDPDGTLTTLHAIGTPEVDGEVPTGSLAMDSAGNLYGTTLGSGQGTGGTLYKLNLMGERTTLRYFIADFGEESDDPGGQNPEGGVLLGTSGNLYGTTRAGGTKMWGVAYELNPQSGAWRVLHTFAPEIGGGPISPLIEDEEGNLYGTARVGGNAACGPDPGCGIVFKIAFP